MEIGRGRKGAGYGGGKPTVTALPFHTPPAQKETWQIHLPRGLPDFLCFPSSGALVSIMVNPMGLVEF